MKWYGKVNPVSGADGIDVGDTVRVRLVSVNAAKGLIDFERQ
jgi:hypothetical protein